MPTLGMTRQLGFREGAIFSLLNGNSSELYASSIFEFSLMVDTEESPEENDSWLCLKVYFIENLEFA
jgi:hypothetical protein